MPAAPLQFKRLVLGLQAGRSRFAMDLAIDTARLLDLELFGLFLEDAGLRRLSGMPATRALRTLGGGWREIDWAEVRLELDLAAGAAERQFADMTRSLARRQFAVVCDSAAHALASFSRADDILVIEAPATVPERIAEPFASLVESAFRSAAAVMLAPWSYARGSGPIAAIATRPNDPSIGAAAAIAARLGRASPVIQARGDALGGAPFPSGLARGAHGVVDVAASAVAQALRQSGAQLAVISRDGSIFDLAHTIELSRATPVLSIDGSDTPAGAARGI